MADMIDIHCTKCNQVIVPSERMKSLVNWQQQHRSVELMVVHFQSMVIMNADFICPTCGAIVYFRLSEQKLNLLLSQINKS